jgi:hypothetical protein
MKTIYKYDAPIADDLAIELPIGAEVLCVQVQGDGPKIWARVDPGSNTMVTRRFHWRGTGHPADGCGRYIGTVQAMGGALVFHLFEAA